MAAAGSLTVYRNPWKLNPGHRAASQLKLLKVNDFRLAPGMARVREGLPQLPACAPPPSSTVSSNNATSPEMVSGSEGRPHRPAKPRH